VTLTLALTLALALALALTLTLTLTLPQDMRGSASPKGEARRECAAKPKQSAGRGRHAAHSRESEIALRVGVGGRCN